ncbi:uncharacterized protein LOC114360434 [Ostrinia furnacalis]|uniref:uncharacterized protein LOC114360434 n=1 Tax=Ostrinia furnacalis TaxID=93504 RepID=UPI00103D0334|nr:uncharacterized protein LOC114360434 [Ostrinia furnacalis]
MLRSYSEISRSSIFINRIEDISLAWCSSHLGARIDSGIHFYEFSGNLNCLDKRLDFNESFLKTPTSSPSSTLLTKKAIGTRLKNRELAEMITDTALWPHSEYLVKEMSTVVTFQWSPRELLGNNECILAVLNNIGGVELFRSSRNMWINVISLTDLVHDHVNLNSAQNDFKELKEAAYSLESSSICWPPTCKEGKSYFVTGQKNGTILFWVVESTNKSTTTRFFGKIDTDLGETVSLLWIPKSEAHFLLVATNLFGLVACFECQINGESLVLKNTLMLWNHSDKMLVQHIQYEKVENKLLLIFNKYRHLVLQLLDENSKNVSQEISYINDYLISHIITRDNEVYVSTVNLRCYKINYSIKGNTLKIYNHDMVEFKELSPTCELCSVNFSDNNVLCALAVIDRKILHRKERLKAEIIFLQVLPDNAEVDILLNNPTKQITNYWDCIELIRYKIVKTKSLPQIDYDSLLSQGDSDIYKLKVYLVILTIYKSLQTSIKIVQHPLPENSTEVVKDKILAMNAKSNIAKISNKQSKNDLSDLEKESYAGSKKYLNYYSKKYKVPMNKIMPGGISDVATQNYCYTCQNCDEEIIDFSCKNGHLNMFCMFTFTPIESIDYLSCHNCNAVARMELLEHKPYCLFCDTYLKDSQ